jgi:pyrroline-5-carboxylate reductase
MLLQENKTFDQLIATVASPGGTTEAGLKKLEADGVYKAIHAAVANAIRKAKELEES